MKQYVCLEGLKEGNKFFTTNHEGEDPTVLQDGTVAYKILGYADTVDEAHKILYPTKEAFQQVLIDNLMANGNFTEEQARTMLGLFE